MYYTPVIATTVAIHNAIQHERPIAAIKALIRFVKSSFLLQDQPRVIKKMLMARDLQGHNLLMSALLTKNPSVAIAALRIFVKFNTKVSRRYQVVRDMLMAQNSKGHSVLMCAIQAENPMVVIAALIELIKLIPELSEQQQVIKDMLMVQDLEGHSVLMSAMWLSHTDRAVDALIKLLKLIPEEERHKTIKEMLAAKDLEKCNTLVHVTWNISPADAIAALIKFINCMPTAADPREMVIKELSTLESPEADVTHIVLIPKANMLRQKLISEMLTAKNQDGKDVLELAEEIKPSAVPMLRSLARAERLEVVAASATTPFALVASDGAGTSNVAFTRA